MVGATLLFLFQVAAGEPAAAPDASAPAAEPKVVCRMEKVTGSRARKQKVCKTEGYDKAGEASKRAFQDFQNKASTGGPMGVKPGGG
jgi:hypothetical protein